MIRRANHAAGLLTAIVGIGASAAFAGPVCTFTQECYMDLACEESAYEVTLELDRDRVSTLVSNMEILHYHKTDMGTQLVAQGMGGLHMLTIGPAASVLTVHIGAGPASITYYGTCGDE